MKSLKIFLAAIVILLFSNLLTACSPKETAKSSMSELGMARIEAAMELKKTAELQLKELSTSSPDEKHFQLILNNPDHQPITSVESWLSYDPSRLDGLEFKANEKQFELSAPYENGFDAQNGMLKFGRSTARPVRDTTIILAEFTLKNLKNYPMALEAFDYREDLAGHQSVNVMHGKRPVNILLKPSSPFFVF